MERQKRENAFHGWWAPAIIGLILLVALTGACSSQPTPGPSSVDRGGEAMAQLQQTVVAQQNQIAGLQDKVAALQTAVGQPKAAAATPAPAARVAAVIPTLIPPVGGLPTSGTTKGAADARVTITEYSDYQ